MANQIIIQGCEKPDRLDILVKLEGMHAEHYCRIYQDQVDSTVAQAKEYAGAGAEVIDHRK